MRLFLLVLMSFSVGGSELRANVVPEWTYQQKLRQSEIVVIATVSSANVTTAISTARVILKVKGSSPRTIHVHTSHPVAEMRTRCCRKGATYMMFLRKTGGSFYEPVNGRFGLVEIGR
jgi:hypothetical protein